MAFAVIVAGGIAARRVIGRVRIAVGALGGQLFRHLLKRPRLAGIRADGFDDGFVDVLRAVIEVTFHALPRADHPREIVRIKCVDDAGRIHQRRAAAAVSGRAVGDWSRRTRRRWSPFHPDRGSMDLPQLLPESVRWSPSTGRSVRRTCQPDREQTEPYSHRERAQFSSLSDLSLIGFLIGLLGNLSFAEAAEHNKTDDSAEAKQHCAWFGRSRNVERRGAREDLLIDAHKCERGGVPGVGEIQRSASQSRRQLHDLRRGSALRSSRWVHRRRRSPLWDRHSQSLERPSRRRKSPDNNHSAPSSGSRRFRMTLKS